MRIKTCLIAPWAAVPILVLPLLFMKVAEPSMELLALIGFLSPFVLISAYAGTFFFGLPVWITLRAFGRLCLPTLLMAACLPWLLILPFDTNSALGLAVFSMAVASTCWWLEGLFSDRESAKASTSRTDDRPGLA